MSGAPLIGLPGRRTSTAQIDGFPDSLASLDVDIYLADYARAVLDAGGLPIHLPLDVEPSLFIDHLDGLILTGGADVDPGRYGRTNLGSDVDAQRDEIEFALLAGALGADLPVLGICRGLQILNVHAGGTLHQHVPEHVRYDVDPAQRIHTATIEPASVLYDLYGGSVAINSLHHQTVDVVGSGLTVIATDSDGSIEGLQMQGRDVVAVQWHPEFLNEVEPIFAWLVEKAAAVRAAR
jgi:putative glutamine amidotransferase